MFEIALTGLFFVMAYRISRGIFREAGIFREFNQSRALGLEVLLFPIGPMLIFYFSVRAPLIGIGLAAACYLPALLHARAQSAAFERAGTDKVKAALSLVSQAFGTAIAGLIYIAVCLALALSIGSIRGITDA